MHTPIRVALAATVLLCSPVITAQDEVLDPVKMNIVRTPVVPPTPPEYPSLRPEVIEADPVLTNMRSKYSVPPWSLGFRGRGVHAPRFGVGPTRSFERAIAEAIDYQSSKDSLMNIDITKSPENISFTEGTMNNRTDRYVFRDGWEFDLDGAHFKADALDLDGGTGLIRINGDVDIASPSSHLTADSFFLQRQLRPSIPEEERERYYLLPSGYDPYATSSLGDGNFEAYNLHYTEVKRAFDAEHLRYDSISHSGEFTNVRGHADPFYFSAKSIRALGPGQYEAEDVWFTTCDLDDPHYRIRFSQARIDNGKLVLGKNTKLQIGKRKRTFFYLPKISGISFTGEDRLRLELETGQKSELGYYLNVAQWYSVTPNVDLAYRFYPTADEGIGFGIDGTYDYTQNPASRLFGAKGEFETLYTTKDRGYTQWYHRQDFSDKLTGLAQWEQWYDKDFVKDFYNDEYEDRSGPRTFANLTYRDDRYLVTGTASKSTHNFLSETEKLPEASFHLLDRKLANNFYFSMDTVVGSYRQVPSDFEAQRYSQVARLSYDMNLMPGLNVVPFVEGSATQYSETLTSTSSDTRITGLAGITTQARFQRSYGGFGKFDGFKHLIIPSVTYFHEDSSSLHAEDIPRFDAIDNRPGRERIESKIDNLLLGRNSENGQTWQVAKLAFYQGEDISNEIARTTDYEIDLEFRPRPWWGIRSFAEQHRVDTASTEPGQDFDRLLSYVFYDDNNFDNSFNARVGYALTKFDSTTIDREVLYGVGYKLSKKWSVSADHAYDLENNELRRQSYQIRRRMHEWDLALRIRDRPSGTDINVVLSLVGFSGTSLRF